MENEDAGLQALQFKLTDALLSVNRLMVKEILTQPGLSASPFQLVEKLVVPTLETIGVGWEAGKYSLSQVYMCGKICEEVVDMILPPSDSTRRFQPKTAIVVLEDYHMLGARIVYTSLRASGFELTNYGRLTVAEAVDRVKLDQVSILLISVLMLPSALRIKQLRTKLNEAGWKGRMIVGGAPFRFDDHLWQEVGADAFGGTAAEAVELIDRIIEDL